MQPTESNQVDIRLAELATQRELFWRPRRRKLKLLPSEWRKAIERGEELLRDAHRLK
jgi:hypothetical protein